MKITIHTENEYGDMIGERVSLPAAYWEGHKQIGTGIWIDGLFYGPKSRRFFVETYSVWENRLTHGCVGQQFEEVSRGRFIDLCDRVGVNPPDDIEASATIIE